MSYSSLSSLLIKFTLTGSMPFPYDPSLTTPFSFIIPRTTMLKILWFHLHPITPIPNLFTFSPFVLPSTPLFQVLPTTNIAIFFALSISSTHQLQFLKPKASELPLLFCSQHWDPSGSLSPSWVQHLILSMCFIAPFVLRFFIYLSNFISFFLFSFFHFRCEQILSI